MPVISYKRAYQLPGDKKWTEETLNFGQGPQDRLQALELVNRWNRDSVQWSIGRYVYWID